MILSAENLGVLVRRAMPGNVAGFRTQGKKNSLFEARPGISDNGNSGLKTDSNHNCGVNSAFSIDGTSNSSST